MFFDCLGMARADSLPITPVVSNVREIRRRSDGHVKPGYDSPDLGRYLLFVLIRYTATCHNVGNFDQISHLDNPTTENFKQT